ncbi:MAG: Urmylation protein [Trizodia sp. TS-e1964]|nr:MAG: Urmylation protein [Trizodia sp. TS-e1964]
MQHERPLSGEEYKRYGRQMILLEIGLQGQLRLRSSSILIVGIGGLGCPAAAYLAGAGVGRIGLIDGDIVEISNLHRQILHTSKTVNVHKVDSARQHLQALNPNVEYVPYREHLSPAIAVDIFPKYDIIIDCTDHPTSRYLISDAAVLFQKPLISASALRTDGQLMVLNQPARPAGDTRGGPCYRCIFPRPPPAESVTSCSDGGILGPVVGTMGVLQALEAIKLILPDPAAPRDPTSPDPQPSLLLFSALSTPPFRSIRLRGRRAGCAACSSQASISIDSLASGSLDYELFCGRAQPLSILSPSERVSATEFSSRRASAQPCFLIDVREAVQFDICSLPGSVNAPLSELEAALPSLLPAALPPTTPIFVICRLGNDSQLAVQQMKFAGLDLGGRRFVGDVRDGFMAWRNDVDPSWPEY